jgi:hypothetical protein
MPGTKTEVTEILTGVGTLGADLEAVLAARPNELLNVPQATWEGVVAACREPKNRALVESSFSNGRAFFESEDGLRRRVPLRVEWKGPHRPPGDDVIPADIRIDHVFQVSCKYLSKILQNAGPVRLFERNLVGEQRTRVDWFASVAPDEYQRFYGAFRDAVSAHLPERVGELTPHDRSQIKEVFRGRPLPDAARTLWRDLCVRVSRESSERWRSVLLDERSQLRTLWRILRIGDAPYFILGASGASQMRLRVASAWDWSQDFEFRALTVQPRSSGQPEVSWQAEVLERESGSIRRVVGHVEIRWSHGRFQGAPEAKIYLDTPHDEVPGFFQLM